MADLVQSIPVDGPRERRVRVLFYSDGSIRFRIAGAAPMFLSEAFLRGRDGDVILKLDPEVKTTDAAAVGVIDPAARRDEIIELLRQKDDIGVVLTMRRLIESLRQETLTFARGAAAEPTFHRFGPADTMKAWGFVYEPFIEVLGPRMKQVVSAFTALVEFAPKRVADVAPHLERFFETDSRTGSRVADGLPALVAVLTALPVLGFALAVGRADAFVALSQPKFKSYKGMLPWTVSNEFHHLDTLERQAGVLGELARDFARSTDAATAGGHDFSDAVVSAGLLLAILGHARSGDGGPYGWGAEYSAGSVNLVLRELATNDTFAEPIAGLVGEDTRTFRGAFIDRYRAVRSQVPHLHRGEVDEDVLRLFVATEVR